VRLIRRERLAQFIGDHKDAATSLNAWAKAVESRDFKHLVDLKSTLGSADYVKPYVVFDIAGNKYRLIALINFRLGIASVEWVLTHAEYDQGKWRR
jgi:mRNA interferase HigB